MPGRPPAATPFRTLVAASLVLAASACVDGSGPTGSDGWSVPLDLRPQFQVDLGLFPSSPIDRIRFTATDVTTSQIVSEGDVTVDPQALEWEIPLAIDLGDAASLEVLVTVELLSGGTVEWSGRLGPVTVQRSGPPLIRSVQVHRGPLENLDVVALTLSGAPGQMSVGATTSLGAQVTLAGGVGDVAPIVYWATTDPSVATITGTGTAATLTAVAAGTVDVVAVSGSAHDEVTIEIVDPSYDVDWIGTTTDWLDPANWSTGQVPGPTDDVYIAVASAFPVLTGDVAVAGLGVAATATLTTSADLTVAGDLRVEGSILGGGFVLLTGADATVQGMIDAQLEVLGTVRATGPLTARTLDVLGTGAMSTGPHAVNVCCSVNVTGTLTVPADGSLTIGDGTISLQQGSALHVDGVVSAITCIDNGATITGGGTHPCGSGPAGTRNWTGAVSSAWHDAGNWAEGAVPTLSDDVVVPASSTVQLGADGEAASLSLADNAALILGGFTLTVDGDIMQGATGSGIVGGTVRVTGTGTLGGYFPELELGGDRALTSFLNVAGSLTIVDADLDVAGNDVDIIGDLAVTGPNAHLVMTTQGSVVYVYGSALFDGGDHAGLLTTGILAVEESLTVTGRTPTSFAADTGHSLYLTTGQTDRTVSFALPGPTQQRIGQLLVSAFSTRTSFATDAHVLGDTDLGGWTAVDPGSTVTIDGDLQFSYILQVDAGATLTAASCVNSNGLLIGSGTQPCGSPTLVDRTWIGGSAAAPRSWEEPTNWLPAGTPTATEAILIPQRVSTNTPLLNAATSVGALIAHAPVDLLGNVLTVAGDVVANAAQGGEIRVTGQGAQLTGSFADLRIAAARALSGFVVANGSVFVDAPLTVGQQAVSVLGDLTIAGAGLLQMQDPSGSVYVAGDVTFEGAGHSNVLTAGVLQVEGDFTARATNAQDAFRSSGTLVYLFGSNAQIVTLDDPLTQTFDDLLVFKSGGAVELANDIYVAGDFQAQQSVVRAPAPGPFVEVAGRTLATAVTFQGVPLRIVSPVGILPGDHLLSQLAFTAMPGDVSQLYISMPGAGATEPLLLDAPAFGTVPDGRTGFYVQAVNSAATFGTLVVNVASPSPATANGLFLTDQFSQIVWPF